MAAPRGDCERDRTSAARKPRWSRCDCVPGSRRRPPTGWGCPRIDEDVLGRAPRLKLVAHTGSSVRPIVSDALWAREIRVVSAAAANAGPVAEFTLAAILLAAKGAFTVREVYRSQRVPPQYPW